MRASASSAPATAARAGRLKLWPRTAASETSARSAGSRPSRRAATRAVRVSGTADLVQVTRQAGTPRPRARGGPGRASIRTVSTAYRGTPSARATIGGGGLRRQPGHEPCEQALHVRGCEGLEVDRGERAKARPPVRAAVEELGPGQGDERDRDPRLHSITWSMKSSNPVSACWRSSNTRTTGAVFGQPLEERPPGGEQLVRSPMSVSTPSRASRAGSIQRVPPRDRDVGRGRSRRSARAWSPRRRPRRARPCPGPSRPGPRR